MGRTLAEMTPEERQSCVGMWCEFELGALSILQQVGVDRAYCIIPNGFNVEQSMRLERLTPRFDLLRAWEPDGSPACEDIETAEVSLGHVYFDGSERVKFPDGTAVCRFVGEWRARGKAG